MKAEIVDRLIACRMSDVIKSPTCIKQTITNWTVFEFTKLDIYCIRNKE